MKMSTKITSATAHVCTCPECGHGHTQEHNEDNIYVESRFAVGFLPAVLTDCIDATMACRCPNCNRYFTLDLLT